MSFTFNQDLEVRPRHLKEMIAADSNSGQSTLSSTLTAYLAWIKSPQGLNRPYSCPHCQENGEYQLLKDTGNPTDTQMVDCATCDTWGYTANPKTSYGLQYKDA